MKQLSLAQYAAIIYLHALALCRLIRAFFNVVALFYRKLQNQL